MSGSLPRHLRPEREMRSLKSHTDVQLPCRSDRKRIRRMQARTGYVTALAASFVNFSPVKYMLMHYYPTSSVLTQLLSPPDSAPVITNPCNPSPCGPNSQCREINGQGVCSCVPGYIGSPPTCRPECVVSAECPQNEACSNQKCRDPCPGTCGVGARCEVINHNPICTCPPRYQGDPFVRCQPTRKSPTQLRI